MIADLKGGQLDWVDQVPFKAVNVVKEDSNIVVDHDAGRRDDEHHLELEPAKPKNRELLDPQVKKALSMCVDREKIIDVVFNGYADNGREPRRAHLRRSKTRTSGRSSTTARRPTRCWTSSATSEGSDGIRVVPATTGRVRAAGAPDGVRDHARRTRNDFNIDREFDDREGGIRRSSASR